MTFFERKGIWKSLLELDDQKRESGKPPSLDDAAAVARFLGAEEEVRPVLHGVLSVKIRTATLIKFDRFSARPTSSQCQISIRNVTKKTRLVEDQQGTLRWDQIKHFPICVVRNFRHPYNLLKIELSVFESASSMDGYVVGSIFFHLHDIIKANPIAGTFDLWDENFQVGDIGLELTFTYGHFGYGYSHQLQEDDTNSIETVQYSLLPRITPRRDQREPEESVMVVCATPHPSFLPFKEKAYLSYGKDIRKALEEAEEAAYDPDYFRKELGSFDAARDEYYSTPDRVARLMFLRNRLNGTNQQESMTGTTRLGSASEEPNSRAYTQFVAPMRIPRQDARPDNKGQRIWKPIAGGDTQRLSGTWPS